MTSRQLIVKQRDGTERLSLALVTPPPRLSLSLYLASLHLATHLSRLNHVLQLIS